MGKYAVSTCSGKHYEQIDDDQRLSYHMIYITIIDTETGEIYKTISKKEEFYKLTRY